MDQLAKTKKPMSKAGFIIGAVVLVAATTFLVLYLAKPLMPKEPPESPPLALLDAGVVEGAVDAGVGATPAPPVVSGNAVSVLHDVAGRGSNSKLLARWLKAEGIVQRIAAAVRQVAQGRSPRSVLGFIKVKGRFSVVESWDQRAWKKRLLPKGVKKSEKDRVFIAKKQFRRYDKVVRVFSTANMNAWGQGYGSLRPHFQAVYQEVAKPGEQFDTVLVESLRQLLEVEVPEGQPELIEKGAIFYFKDPELEQMDESEKHLLRMGHKNAQAMQRAMRRFVKAAGLPI